MKTEFEILEEKYKIALDSFNFFSKLHEEAFDDWERGYKEYYDYETYALSNQQQIIYTKNTLEICGIRMDNEKEKLDTFRRQMNKLMENDRR